MAVPKIIDSTMFINRYQLTQNTKDVNKINAYIVAVEKPTIVKMLGATMGNEFWNDIDDGAPVDDKFMAIFDEFEIDDDCGIQTSVGMTEILLALTYAEYTRDADSFNTTAGNLKTEGENSQPYDQRDKIVKIVNRAVDSIKAIQWYIDTNPDEYDYDNYNGQEFEYWFRF